MDERFEQKHSSAYVNERQISVINPLLFYAADVGDMGKGLICKMRLNPQDIWWANNFQDLRYVEKVYNWSEFQQLSDEMKLDIQRRCFVDINSRDIVLCTEPFCRINHGNMDRANTGSDADGNSIITRQIEPDEELLVPYDGYEAVISIVWKFPDFARQVPEELLSNHNFLFSEAKKYPLAVQFLEGL